MAYTDLDSIAYNEVLKEIALHNKMNEYTELREVIR